MVDAVYRTEEVDSVNQKSVLLDVLKIRRAIGGVMVTELQGALPAGMKKQNAKPTPDLGERCVEEALRIIEERGVDALNMREVARRLGVSHQAPYKHFESRDHVLAEVVARVFADFADSLDQAGFQGAPEEELDQMIHAYFKYALDHPYRLRLIFDTELPDPVLHPGMLQNSKQALDHLFGVVARLPTTQNDPNPQARTERDALYVWSAIHGFSSIRNSHAWARLQFSGEVRTNGVETISRYIRDGLGITK